MLSLSAVYATDTGALRHLGFETRRICLALTSRPAPICCFLQGHPGPPSCTGHHVLARRRSSRLTKSRHRMTAPVELPRGSTPFESFDASLSAGLHLRVTEFVPHVRTQFAVSAPDDCCHSRR